MSLRTTLVVVLILVVLAPALLAQEDGGTDAESGMTKEERKAHDKDVKRRLHELLAEKNKVLVIAKMERFGKDGAPAKRDALILYVRRTKNQEHKNTALLALAEIGGKKVCDFLCGKDALKSRDFMVQRSAATALGILKDPRAIDPLLEVMTSKYTKIQVVGGCAKALAQSYPNDEKVVKTLFDYTHHKKDTIRSMSLEALGYLASDAAVERLTEALLKERNTRARGAAATGLGHTLRRDVIPLLEERIGKDNSLTVKDCCSRAIKYILDPPD